MELVATTLRGELKRLRRDEGRTLVKLLASPALRAALGDPPERELQDQFDGAVLSLGFDLRSLALKNAYAIGVRDPQTLTARRVRYGGQPEVSRGPETINDWEDEKIGELAARLLAGLGRQHDEHLLVAVAIVGGVITVVAEGAAESGAPQRQMANPMREPFLPGFIYRLPPHARPKKLTISALFMDEPPSAVYAMASGDLLVFVCGDGRQALPITRGSFGDVETVAHATVHYAEPEPVIFYGLHWQPRTAAV